jgi:hypothetical protein
MKQRALACGDVERSDDNRPHPQSNSSGATQRRRDKIKIKHARRQVIHSNILHIHGNVMLVRQLVVYVGDELVLGQKALAHEVERRLHARALISCKCLEGDLACEGSRFDA